MGWAIQRPALADPLPAKDRTTLLLSCPWDLLICTHRVRYCERTGPTLQSATAGERLGSLSHSHDPGVAHLHHLMSRTRFRVLPRQGVGPTLPSVVAGKGQGQFFCFHDSRTRSATCCRWQEARRDEGISPSAMLPHGKRVAGPACPYSYPQGRLTRNSHTWASSWALHTSSLW